MLSVLFLWTRVDEDIFDEDYDKSIKKIVEHLVHHIHKGCLGIRQTEWHDQNRVVAITNTKIGFDDVFCQS